MDANSGLAAGIVCLGSVADHDSALGHALARAWRHPVFRAWLGIGVANLSLGTATICCFKRRYPKPAELADWSLRRPSHKRRMARKKQAKDD